MTAPAHLQPLAVRQRTPRKSQAGFTLIEVLVSFAILAIMTIVIQRGVTTALGGMSKAGSRLEAEMVARTLMTGPLGAGPEAATPKRGQMHGHAWAIRFEQDDLPFPPMTADGKAPAWTPMRMLVTVSDDGANRSDVTVETVRLIRVSAP